MTGKRAQVSRSRDMSRKPLAPEQVHSPGLSGMEGATANATRKEDTSHAPPTGSVAPSNATACGRHGQDMRTDEVSLRAR